MPGHFTKAIQEAFAASGWTLMELAERSGVSPAQISRFVTGKRTLRLPAVEQLCDALGLELRPATTANAKLSSKSKRPTRKGT